MAPPPSFNLGGAHVLVFISQLGPRQCQTRVYMPLPIHIAGRRMFCISHNEEKSQIFSTSSPACCSRLPCTGSTTTTETHRSTCSNMHSRNARRCVGLPCCICRYPGASTYLLSCNSEVSSSPTHPRMLPCSRGISSSPRPTVCRRTYMI